jgi:hypothetical protein
MRFFSVCDSMASNATYAVVGVFIMFLKVCSALITNGSVSCSKAVGDAMLTCREDVMFHQNFTESRCCNFVRFRTCLHSNSKQYCGYSTAIVVNETLVDYFPIESISCARYEGSLDCIVYHVFYGYTNWVLILVIVIMILCKSAGGSEPPTIMESM